MYQVKHLHPTLSIPTWPIAIQPHHSHNKSISILRPNLSMRRFWAQTMMTMISFEMHDLSGYQSSIWGLEVDDGSGGSHMGQRWSRRCKHYYEQRIQSPVLFSQHIFLSRASSTAKPAAYGPKRKHRERAKAKKYRPWTKVEPRVCTSRRQKPRKTGNMESKADQAGPNQQEFGL